MANFNQLVFYTKKPRAKPTTFALADGTTWKQVLLTADPATRITAIPIINRSAASKVIFIRLNDGSAQSQIGHISLPANAGNDGIVPVVSGLNRGNLPWLLIDAQGNPFIDLNYGMNLEMRMSVALTGSDTVDVVCYGGDFTE